MNLLEATNVPAEDDELCTYVEEDTGDRCQSHAAIVTWFNVDYDPDFKVRVALCQRHYDFTQTVPA